MATSKTISRRKFLKTLALASSAAAVDWTGIGALAAQIQNKKDFPIAVIGSGLGGLVSAAYLSKFGFNVTVLEQHSIPGGYATSFDRGDFTFDVSLHATVAEHAMPQMILSDLGLWDKLKVAYTPELRRIITNTFDVTLPAKDPEGVKKELSNVFPHEKKGIHVFYKEMEQVIAELWGGKRLKPSIMETLEPLSLEQWMNRHVKDTDVKKCMAIFSGYYGLPPGKINALFYAIATGEYLVHGGQYFKTRSQDLSDTLALGIENFNGIIHYNTEVETILFNNNKIISGVKDTNGNIYPAKAVIANCPVPALVNKMIPKDFLPHSFAAKAGQRQASLSSFVVWLGLSSPIDLIKDYEIDLVDAGIGVTLYDNLFDGYSAPGKSTVSIMRLEEYEPWEKFETDYFNNNKGAYNKEKKRITTQFIEQVEKTLIPGLSSMIEEIEIGTPLTNVFFTGNTKGAIYGYDRNLPHLNTKTPIKGLYLASAWSHGGGYTPVMMGGRDTAKLVLKDFKSLKL